MANVALLIGNSEYKKLNRLECCKDDVLAISDLLRATHRFDRIELFENQDAMDLKENIRLALRDHPEIEELFFYFTGHGYQHESEFFYCAPNFEIKRPNETGLSHPDLYTMLRNANADLVVNVVDACNSGTLLVKSNLAPRYADKGGIKNLIQFASCLDSQNALTGNPLSLFTEKFRDAALKKNEGIIYYTDILDTLRDDFLNHASQTPHFVTQGTAQSQFVDDARKLDRVREAVSLSRQGPAVIANLPVVAELVLSPVEILQQREKAFAGKEVANNFIGDFFQRITERVSADQFEDIYVFNISTHTTFHESTTRNFIVRVLKAEKRPDSFVSVSTTQKKRKQNPFGLASAALASLFVEDDEWIESHSIDLNCTLDKVQLAIVLTPKFNSLNRWSLVVSCAPSLEHCYVFEMLTEHSRSDWDSFDYAGSEVSRRWYKMKWDEPCINLVEKICSKLHESVAAGIDKVVTVAGEN